MEEVLQAKTVKLRFEICDLIWHGCERGGGDLKCEIWFRMVAKGGGGGRSKILGL